MKKTTTDKPVKLTYTLKQVRTAENYFNPKNLKTFGNLYQSAVDAGYSKNYAKSIVRDTPWIHELKAQMQTYEPDHIYRGFQDIAQHGAQDRDRLKALELMGKARGMFIDRVQQDVQVRFINEVPRPDNETVIDLEEDQ